MLKVRRSHNRLIFDMGLPMPGKDGLYIETGCRQSDDRLIFTIGIPILVCDAVFMVKWLPEDLFEIYIDYHIAFCF